MQAAVHEVEFTGLVLGWVAQLIQNNGPDFPISEARIEGRARGSQKRRDLTLYDRDGSPCLTGEVKLPWAPDGYSPFVEDVVLDAREKAARAGVEWFVTWNINELLLWRRDDLGALGTARTVERYHIASVQRPDDLHNPKILQAIRNEVERFIVLFARTLRGERSVDRRPPDLYFIHSLESSLARPIQLTRLELGVRYGRQKEKDRLDSWMRDRQGWTLGGDEDDLLLRAAKFTNYTVGRIDLYSTKLCVSAFPNFRELNVPAHVDTGERLLDHLRAFFDEACHVTGNYETVFGVDPNDVGDRIPFYANAVVASWRLLTQHVHRFDFSRLEYDVIGQIFETLIGPEERHSMLANITPGQRSSISLTPFVFEMVKTELWTRAAGVGPFSSVPTPASGILPPVWITRVCFAASLVWISRFATHLSTINLAARDLVDAQNYPPGGSLRLFRSPA